MSISEYELQNEARVEKAESAFKALIDSTNVMSGEQQVVEGMVNALTGSHRTLQQSFMRCFVETMREYKDTGSDERNQASVAFAKKVCEDDQYIFPFV